MSHLLFFLSDFGLADPYVGIVKGVIKEVCPEVEILDLAHDLPPQDLRRGAYALYESVPYLPEGSVILAVVDPGVGSDRRALAVQGRRHLYVAPDNGLLSLAWRLDPPQKAYLIRGQPASATFHGRDLFAPAAARLACGAPLESIGTQISLNLVELPVRLSEGPEGEILTFDRFGNAISTLRGPVPAEAVELQGRLLPLRTTYAQVARGEALAYWGSGGLLEIAVREGNAREALHLSEGIPLRLLGGPARARL